MNYFGGETIVELARSSKTWDSLSYRNSRNRKIIISVGIGKVYESVYLKGVCESGLSSDKQKHPYVTRKSDSRKLLGANPNLII